MHPVTLVTMPVVDLERPNLGLSLLQSLLARDGVTSRIVYANLQFAERIGLHRYLQLCRGTRGWYTLFLGEAMFAPAAFPDRPFPVEEAIRFMLGGLALDEEAHHRAAAQMRDTQRIATDFVEWLARALVAERPRMVGCTSTFQQHVPSLALLRRIRQLDPSIVTLMGGGNCDVTMGLATHRSFPWVDYVVSGEADGLIGELVHGILSHGRELETVPGGVLAPFHRYTEYPKEPRATFNDLESLPYPEFADYFEQLSASPLAPAVRVGLPVETSRGCWWGAKHHCTFCGLNGGGMSFRRKSPARAVAELEALSERWGITDVEVVDNILDQRYLDTVIPALAASPRAWNIFYEVKSNLKPAQLRALAAAGVRSLQPGIESLDTRVLALMDKGAKGWQQVQFLKLSRELGIGLSWNLLMDFPGEEDAWYAEMAQLAPLLFHLQPPSAMVWIRFDRFSPYFERRYEYGLALRPHPMMAMIYPGDSHDLCYHFERAEGSDLQPRGPGVQALEAAVVAWKAAFGSAELRFADDGTVLTVSDSRPCAVQERFELRGRHRELYLACLEAASLEPCEELESLVRDRLVVRLDGRYLALAVAAGAPLFPYIPAFPGGDVRPELLETAALRPRGGAFERMFWDGEDVL